MKVRMTVSMAGAYEVREPGQVLEVDDAEGARLVAAEFAVEAVPTAPETTSARKRRAKVETATTPAVETPEG